MLERTVTIWDLTEKYLWCLVCGESLLDFERLRIHKDSTFWVTRDWLWIISLSLIAFQWKKHGYDGSAVVPLFINLSEKVKAPKMRDAKLGFLHFSEPFNKGFDAVVESFLRPYGIIPFTPATNFDTYTVFSNKQIFVSHWKSIFLLKLIKIELQKNTLKGYAELFSVGLWKCKTKLSLTYEFSTNNSK